MLTLLGAASLPPDLAAPQRRRLRWGLALAGVITVTGSLRFVIKEAVPGMVQGGEAANGASAVSRLREILFAEDAMRRYAHVDPDGDRIGSAALLPELTQQLPLRGRQPLELPILNERFTANVATKLGPAASAIGYLFIVCLPKQGGGYTAQPGERVDEERAEREYVALAWPEAAGQGPREAYFMDQDERIMVHPNLDGQELRWAGAFFPPPCDAALAASSASEWRPWRDKRARPTRPGDRAQAATTGR